jgi:transcriptional regulator with XRE-family HTH domain
MKTTTALEKLNAIAIDESKQWEEKADWRKENREWLNKSAKIAIRILREIRVQKQINGMSQKRLAELVGVSPQYVNKIVKGQENLSLETICKIEKALGIILIETPTVEVSSEMIFSTPYGSIAIPRNLAKSFAKEEREYQEHATYQPVTSELVA